MDEFREQKLRREVDSMDDFEHLGHDSSPLREKVVETGDLLGLDNSSSQGAAVIDKRAVDPFDVASFHVGHPPTTERSAIQSFLDGEREPIIANIRQDRPQVTTTTTTTAANDLLDRYSDSEPEPEDFQKHQEPTKINEPEDRFKDLDVGAFNVPLEPVKAPEPPKREPEPPKPVEVIAKEPEPVRQEPPKQEQESPKVEQPKSKEPVQKPKIAPADAEAMFCKMGLVESLIYWRDPKKSGPVFGSVLIVLLALTYFSLISVVAYLSLIALSGTIAFRIYKNIVQAVQKTGDGHPFKEQLEMDITVPQEKINQVVEKVAHLNAIVVELRRLFLVEDLVDSIKFGVMLWTLTYVGAWFNGMTLIIIAWVALFTLPKVYETNKTQIDANLEIVRTKLAEITSKVKAAIPIGKKPEEKKEQ